MVALEQTGDGRDTYKLAAAQSDTKRLDWRVYERKKNNKNIVRGKLPIYYNFINIVHTSHSVRVIK